MSSTIYSSCSYWKLQAAKKGNHNEIRPGTNIFQDIHRYELGNL